MPRSARFHSAGSGVAVEIGEIRLFGGALGADESAELLDLVVVARVAIAGQRRRRRGTKTRRARERERIEVGHPRRRHRRERRWRGRISEQRGRRAPVADALPPTNGGGSGFGIHAPQRKNARRDLLADENARVAVETVVGQVVEIRRVEGRRLRGIHADQHVVRRRGNGGGTAALRLCALDLSISA